MKPLIVLLFVIGGLTGCNRYYAPANVSVPSGAVIEKYVRDNRTFVLHDNSFSYKMTNVKVSAENDSLIGTVKRLNINNETRGGRKKIYYRYNLKTSQATVSKQVHLFTNQTLTGKNPERHIAVTSFHKMQDLKFDRAKTTRSHIGTAVGIVAGVAVLAVILASMVTFSWGMAPA